MSYPAGAADDEAFVECFIQHNFTQRFKQGYQEAGIVSPGERKPAKLNKDANGLWWTHANQLVVLEYGRLQFEMFESVHVHPFLGHYGQNRTQKKALQLFFWPNMAADIKTWCQKSDSCQRVKAVRRIPKGALKLLEVPDRRWESFSMDLITDLPVTQEGHDCIFVVVDRLS